MNKLPPRFFCVSANPAIDRRLRLAKLEVGKVNRASDAQSAPGGKAAHVAMVLRTLGADPLWIGTAGGRTGEELLRGLRALSIRAYAERVDPETRVNLELIEASGEITEILEPGRSLTDANWQSFLAACERLFSNEAAGATVIVSGSLPAATDPDFYADLTDLAHRHGHAMFLDTSGEPLRRALESNPDFIKPNRTEAEVLTGEQITNRDVARKAAESLRALGAQSVVISLGHEGLLWYQHGQGTFQAQPESVDHRSTVGCGDATVAAFAYASAMNFDTDKTLRLAAACGAANCLADLPGQLSLADVRNFEPRVRIERMA
ncbi:MAG TPA: 1-phosphofructokinase family hexose kinase [Candidatus Acidoferrum sp.]